MLQCLGVPGNPVETVLAGQRTAPPSPSRPALRPLATGIPAVQPVGDSLQKRVLQQHRPLLSHPYYVRSRHQVLSPRNAITQLDYSGGQREPVELPPPY